MIYLNWALYCEGATDRQYLEVIIPRVLEHVAMNVGGPVAIVPQEPLGRFGVRSRSFDGEAQKISDISDALFILFVHADAGGRALREGVDARAQGLCARVHALCEFPMARCVSVVPDRETEAWCLASLGALSQATGIGEQALARHCQQVGRHAEAVAEPKEYLLNALQNSSGRRRRATRIGIPYASIAQFQSIEALMPLPSFNDFYQATRIAMQEVGFRT